MSEVPHRLEQSSELDYIRIADRIALAVGILVYQQQPTRNFAVRVDVLRRPVSIPSLLHRLDNEAG